MPEIAHTHGSTHLPDSRRIQQYLQLIEHFNTEEARIVVTSARTHTSRQRELPRRSVRTYIPERQPLS